MLLFALDKGGADADVDRPDPVNALDHRIPAPQLHVP